MIDLYASILKYMLVLAYLAVLADAHAFVCFVQGVFTSLYGGVGGGLGGLFGGLVYSTYGAAAVFQIGFLVIIAGWVLCTICQIAAACICAKPQPEQIV